MTRLATSLAASALLFATACADVNHDNEVDALGGETPGGPSELHRPGQPCTTCHGPDGPADTEFSLAGTVYLLRSSEQPAVGALVDIQDQTGFVATVQTNAAGNFYIAKNLWDPVFPIEPRVSYGGVKKPMTVPINRETSCADCHTADSPSRTSPGRIYVVTTLSQLPGMQ
jgi:hypothetical protein